MKFFRRKPRTTSPKSAAREWLNSIVFAVVVATLFRGLLMEAYAIPTGSMENTMLVGDRLFVSKLHYGTRLPKTPLQLPLMHQTIWGTDIPSYLDWIQLPYFRLPGLGEVQRGEPVVFNYPPEWDRPTDMKTFYVKRCVAVPGDTLQIVDRQLFINGEEQPLPPKARPVIWFGRSKPFIRASGGNTRLSTCFRLPEVTKSSPSPPPPKRCKLCRLLIKCRKSPTNPAPLVRRCTPRKAN